MTANYRIDVLPDEPIVLAICLTGFKLGPDMVPMLTELKAILDSAAAPQYIIFDLQDASFGVDDIVATANIANQPELSIANHPKLAKMIAVFRSKILLMSLKGMNSVAFGHFTMPAFPTVDEAVEYAREQIKGG